MKHEEMLTLASIVTARALQDAQIFETVIANWTTQEFQQLNARIESALLQLNPRPLITQKSLTHQVKSSLKQTINDLGILEIFLQAKFIGTETQRGKDIHQLLALDKMSSAKRGDQEALTAILSAFKAIQNTLIPELNAKHIGSNLLSRIQTATTTFHNLNISQELAKGDKIEAYRRIQQERNSIYTYISNICRVGKKLIKVELIAPNRYTKTHILRNIRFDSTRNQHPPASKHHNSTIDK